MKRTKFWIILIIIVLFVSIVASVAIFYSHKDVNIVSVYHQGKLIERINLDTVTLPYQLRVESNEHNYNVITVEPGRICVSEASCPDHICIKTGWLTNGAIPIVCLPNELVIQAESSHQGNTDGSAQ